MLSSVQIIPALRSAISQLIETTPEQLQISGIMLHDNQCTLEWKKIPTSVETNIQIIVRILLEQHNDLCQQGIPENVLIAHLSMLAPNIPLDIISFLQDGICGTISDVHTAISRLDAIAARQERRSSSTIPCQWNVDFDTHIGKRKAKIGQTNQDNFFIGHDEENALFMVADGISISNAGSGNLASNIAVQVVEHMWKEGKEKLRDATPHEIEEFLTNTLYNANYNICETSKQLSQKGIENDVPMGTTVLLAYAQGGFVTLASLGDSRAYLLTDDGPAIVTGDHNVRGEKLRMKIIYEGTSSGNALMRYLGYFNEHYEIALPKPDLRTFHMLPKERLLLCSDGYTDYAAHGHNDLCMLMRDAIENTPLPLACNNLILQANLGGGGDNITVLLAECTKKYIAASGE